MGFWGPEARFREFFFPGENVLRGRDLNASEILVLLIDDIRLCCPPSQDEHAEL